MGMNRLLMGVSTLSLENDKTENVKKIRRAFYSWQGEVCYAGYSQLEPVAQMMYEDKCKEERGQSFEFVLLCTKEVVEKEEYFIHPSVPEEKMPNLKRRVSDLLYEKEGISSYTALEYLIHRIGYYITENPNYLNEQQVGRKLFQDSKGVEVFSDSKADLRFVLIAVDEKATNGEFNSWENGIRNALNYLKDVHSVDAEDCLWVDTHGALREMSMLLVSLLSPLRIGGIVPERILGVLYNGSEGVIVEQKQLQNINLFVSGVEEFINYGSIRILRKYYDNLEKKNEILRMTNSWLDEMGNISNGIQLCDWNSLKNGVAGLKKLKDTLNEKSADSNERLTLDSYFSIFVNYIIDDYKELIEDDDVSTLKLIRRCFEKGMYQQTLTFIESAMPEYLSEKGIVTFNIPSDIKKRKENSHQRYKSDVNFLFDGDDCLRKLGDDNKFSDKVVIDCVLKNYSKVSLYTIRLSDIQYCSLNNLKVKTGVFDNNLITKSCFSKNNMTGKQKKEDVVRLLLLHRTLKNCRNQYNHASRDKRFNLDTVQKLIVAYLLLAEKLVEGAGKKI